MIDFTPCEKDPEPECKGLLFRCRKNLHFTDGRFVDSTEFRLLKRRSCPGCSQCISTLDDLHEIDLETVIHDGQHGRVYELCVTNISHDWETGIVDDWDLEFRLTPS